LGASWFWPASARFPGNWRIFSSIGNSKITPGGLGLQWNGHSKTFWTLTLELLGRIIPPLHFKTERVAETALRASWFWPNSTLFPGTWRIFSSAGDSKLTPGGLGLQYNTHRKTFWTPTFELLARSRAPLHFKTKRVADTALRASWFWPTSARFPGTWGIFWSPGDPKLTADGLDLQWNGHRKSFWTLTLKVPGRKVAPLYFKTEGVPDTALRIWWFWPTSSRFSGTWGMFSIPWDSKLTPDGLALQWNGHSKTLWTLASELLGRNIAPLYFKTERVAETALRGWWFWPTSARFPGTWRIFSSPEDSKVTPDGLGLQWNGYSKTFWRLSFELLGRNITPLYFKIERVAETTLRASSFWPTWARFPGLKGIFSSPGDSKLTPDGLGLQLNCHSKRFWTLTFELLGRNIALLIFKTERVAESALRASWFWSTLARFPGTWRIFSSAEDSKLTPDGLGLRGNGHSKTFWPFTFALLARNIAQLHFQTDRVAETALRAS